MPKYLLILMTLLLSACNLSMPGSSTTLPTPSPDTSSPTTSIADQPTPDYATPAAAQTDWVVYENAAQGYKIQYPASLSLAENISNNEIIIGDQMSVQVSDLNPEDGRGGGTVIQEANDVMLGQYAGRVLKGYVGAIGGNVPHSIEQTVIPHNGKFYILTVTEIKRSQMVSNGREIRLQGPIPSDIRDLYHSILTTLRFDE